MFIKSIRFKIILWYMLILALTLGVFSILLYRNFSQKMYKNIDDVLQSRVEGIVDSIDTYWESERLEVMTGGVKKEVFSKINNINFARIAQRWVEEESDDPALLNTIVQIYDSAGKLIASSKNMTNISIFTKEAAIAELKNRRHFDTVRTELSPGNKVSLRVLTVPVTENEKVAYIAQVAHPLRSADSALNDLKIILFILLPLTVFLTGVIGSFLARITLHPVDRMIDTIHKITADNLKLKVNIPDTKDEIRRLADTFNEMLGRLEHSFSSQRQFLENFAHEIRTPLAVLRGEIEVTLKRVQTVEEYETVLLSNLEEVERINRVVDDLLMLARFDSSAIILEKRSVDLGVLLRKIVDDMRVLAEQKNIIINFSAPHDVIIYGDENQLKRLFINLLDNAIKYTQDSGTVTVSAGAESGFARIVFKDTGAGIPGDEIGHVFDRFYRMDKARKETGYGLGLSIVKSIAEAHKGRIEAVSVINQGAAFTVFLPLDHV
jgi:heavy metal sensor kinase